MRCTRRLQDNQRVKGQAMGAKAKAAKVDTISPSIEQQVSLLLPELSPDLYINRELSWLEFNRRVLQEMREPAMPLLERVKFASIFA